MKQFCIPGGIVFVKVNVVRFLLSDVVASRYNSHIETAIKRNMLTK